jgi:effector-binding domain-containing protein
VPIQDVVVKQTEPVRVAEAVGTVPAYGHENVSPIFVPLFSEVYAYLNDAGVRPGINIAQYEGPRDDGTLILHVGFDLGAQDVVGNERIKVIDLPVVEVASVLHRGTMEDIAPAFEALMRWAVESGYTSVGPSRELYHEWHEDDPTLHVTELQLLVTR